MEMTRQSSPWFQFHVADRLTGDRRQCPPPSSGKDGIHHHRWRALTDGGTEIARAGSPTVGGHPPLRNNLSWWCARGSRKIGGKQCVCLDQYKHRIPFYIVRQKMRLIHLRGEARNFERKKQQEWIAKLAYGIWHKLPSIELSAVVWCLAFGSPL